MTAVPGATDGMFCDTPPLIVSNGQVWDGLFCLEGAVVEVPASGGGGGYSFPGVNLPSPKPSIDKDEPLFLAQALQEDEEMIILLKALAEVVTWH